MRKFILVITVLLLGMAGWYGATGSNKQKENSTGTVTPQPSVKDNTVRVDEAGITLIVPNGLQFSKETQMNLTADKPYSVNFFIQNYKETINEVDHPYQLYGIYQWDTDETSEEQFKKSDFQFDPSTKKEYAVDGHPAVSGATQGERSRYTTYILYKGHLLILAASETRPEHRQLTERIIRSITFD